MSFDSRIGIAGLIVALFGIAAMYLWPDKKWIGWVCLTIAAVLLVTWVVLELRTEKPRPSPDNRKTEPAITIRPEKVQYIGPLQNESYIFVIKNTGDKDIYSIGFNLRAGADTSIDPRDPNWAFRIPPSSLKPMTEGARVADIQGQLCRDVLNQDNVLAFWLYRLTQNESREIVLIRPRFSGTPITVTAEVIHFETAPQPQMSDAQSIVTKGIRQQGLVCDTPIIITIDEGNEENVRKGVWEKPPPSPPKRPSP